MRDKPITPYERLRRECFQWAMTVRNPRTVSMWCYTKADLARGWDLTELFQRVSAADQLGYDVVLSASGEGLSVKYRRRPPDMPWGLHP